MKRKPSLTSVLAAAALCVTWLPQTASAQAKDVAIDAQLLAKYQGTLDGLRKALAAKLPKLDDEKQVNAFLASDKHDDQLVKLALLHEATPEGLAKFAQQGKENGALIDQLLSNPQLMKQMVVADGAKAPLARGKASYTPAQYGPAMKIYTDIQKASPKAKEGVLQQLALAIALELAIPIRDIIDPVERYLEFEKAYLDGELDPAFANFDAWELRFVVDGNEPDWVRAWGRETLRNLRPDHIHTTNDGNRYSGMVRTNVIYGGGRVRQDRPELQNYQNILMNGGICGRRAFFGRFILRSFGIPTIARASRAHGALARWTPGGWVINLGPNWGKGWTNTLYDRDRDFLASTQARMNPEAYIQVKRAQWAGDVVGEIRQYGGPANRDTWGGTSLITQQQIIEELKAVELAAVDAEFGEADDEDESVDVNLSAIKNKQNIRRELSPGEIDIPMESFRLSRENTPRVNLMDGYHGGKQFHFGHLGRSGVQIYRGGSAKGGPGECSSESRLREAGRRGYADWGARVAMTPKDGETTPEVTVDLGDGVTMDFVYIKPGKFIMGGDFTGETKFTCPNAPKHEVTITKGYYLAKTELTQAQFAAGTERAVKNPDHPQPGVQGSTLEDHFFKRVNEKTGRQMRLPTEAEWEYAARAGQSTRWFFGDDPSKLGDYAWFGENAGKKGPQAVGQKKPNPWGLYDMHGNVWEMVSDTYDKDYFAQGPKVDPAGPSGGAGSEIEFTVHIPQAGNYALTAQVCTMNYDQSMNVAVNDDPTETTINLPFTLGAWQDTDPVTLNLKQGENKLMFWRTDGPQYGIAVRSFTLRPAN